MTNQELRISKKLLGAFLRMERRKRDLTQDQLAALAGISKRSSISRIEGGSMNYGIDSFLRIIDVLDLRSLYIQKR